MSECLESGARIRKELEEYRTVFEKEAVLIGSLKCRLLRKEEMTSYELYGEPVRIHEEENGFTAEYRGLTMRFTTEGDRITSASFVGVQAIKKPAEPVI